jgi:4-alpha-glucanotransferase
VRLSQAPGPGYHRLRLRLNDQLEAEQLRVVVPDTVFPVHQRVGRARVFGFVVNLYAVRSDTNWGAGDFGDLETLVDLCSHAGGDFVGLNPLHALRNQGVGISPYSPISRLFRNPLYIDVLRIPELEHSQEARELIATRAFQSVLAELRASDRVDYVAVMQQKQQVLTLLHRTFEENRSKASPRHREYARYRGQKGQALTDFATFLALEKKFGSSQEGWPSWPREFHDPRSPAVQAFRSANEREVDLHCWIQFELDRQLGEAAAHAERAGLRLGLYGDLALGSSWNGSDVWAFPGLFAEGASLGAPPDDYSAVGQDWALPPIHPHRLRDDGYRYWIQLIRTAFEHAGALRIDHVMGLFRQFWIPAGLQGDAGAYVRYPSEDLLGILALESWRARACVIGEDLGTVPRGLPRILSRWGILSSRVLYFERDRQGRFRPAARYSQRALVTVNTHDHAPLAGFWNARDLHLRHALGTLPDADFNSALARREQEKVALVERLGAEGLLPPHAEPDMTSLAAATHGFLARTPAPLLGVSLDDVTGETEPVNVPGVSPEKHASWTRRLGKYLQEIPSDPHAVRILEAVSDRSRRRAEKDSTSRKVRSTGRRSTR